MRLKTVLLPELVEQDRYMIQVFFRRPGILRRRTRIRRLVEQPVFPHAVGGGEARDPGLRAHGLVTHVDIPAYFINGLPNIFPIGMTVNHDPVAAAAAEQLVKRHLRQFCLDIPQRRIHRADSRHGHRPAPPVTPAVKKLP